MINLSWIHILLDLPATTSRSVSSSAWPWATTWWRTTPGLPTGSKHGIHSMWVYRRISQASRTWRLVIKFYGKRLEKNTFQAVNESMRRLFLILFEWFSVLKRNRMEAHRAALTGASRFFPDIDWAEWVPRCISVPNRFLLSDGIWYPMGIRADDYTWRMCHMFPSSTRF